MKMILAAAIAGTFATAAFHPASQEAGIDPVVTGSTQSEGGAAQRGGRYLVANAALGKVCFLSRGATDRVSADRACEAVWPGLSRARKLTENRDGTFALQGRRGRPLLTLVAGDGVAFEAIEPRRALITISAAE